MTKWLVILTVLIAGVPTLLIWMLRYVPPPTTSFMLQSEVRPVQYQWVPAAKIADVARKAVVAAEDQKFWDHHGFDIEAMDKAYRDNQKRRHKHGASTISQQTAKNLFLWPGGGYFRKGIEAGLTVLLETFWTKQRILEVYLNVAEFGPGIYGVEAASQTFFGKPAARLSPDEAARLAAVLPNPTRWSASRPGAYVMKRSAWIMGQMGYSLRGQPTPTEEPEEPVEQVPGAGLPTEEVPDQPSEPSPEFAPDTTGSGIVPGEEQPATPDQPVQPQPEVKPEEPPADKTVVEPNEPAKPTEEKPADDGLMH